MIAARAEKRGFTTGVLEERMIATVVEYPQSQKKSRNEEAVDDRGGGEIHAAVKTEWLSTQIQLTSAECLGERENRECLREAHAQGNVM